MANKNYIKNGGFDRVADADYSATLTSATPLDMLDYWRVQTAASVSTLVIVAGNGPRIATSEISMFFSAVPAGTLNGATTLKQRIRSKDLAGNWVTLSFYALTATGNAFKMPVRFYHKWKSGGTTETILDTFVNPTKTGWTKHTFTFFCPVINGETGYGLYGGGQCYELEFDITNLASGKLVGITDVKLEIATQATDFIADRYNEAEWYSGPNISHDRGDASVVLYPGRDASVQLFSTAITGAKTVTVDTTGANTGERYRIIRTGAGAGTLTVAGKAIAVNQWAEVQCTYDGITLIGFGSL